MYLTIILSLWIFSFPFFKSSPPTIVCHLSGLNVTLRNNLKHKRLSTRSQSQEGHVLQNPSVQNRRQAKLFLPTLETRAAGAQQRCCWSSSSSWSACGLHSNAQLIKMQQALHLGYAYFPRERRGTVHRFRILTTTHVLQGLWFPVKAPRGSATCLLS